MRLFETILVVVLLAAAAAQIARLPMKWSRSLIVLAILVAIWHGIYEGTHWQVSPALVGLILLIASQAIPISLRTSHYPVTKNWLPLATIILSLISFGLFLLFPMFTLPKPTGLYPVGTRTIYLKDPKRLEDRSPDPGTARELIVQIWYPADPSNNHLAAYQRMSETSLASSYRSVLWTNSRRDAPIATKGGPFSLLLFNHAWAGRRTQDTFLTEDLASHGYVVAAIDHTYNASRVALPGYRIISNNTGDVPLDPAEHPAKEILETWNKELSKWVADEVFVLDTLQRDNLDQSSPWYGHLNTERAGAFGHSFGGAAAVQMCSVDARIQSAINMDGWTFGDTRERTSNQPAMFLYGVTSTVVPQNLNSLKPSDRIEAELDAKDREEIDESLKQYGGYRLSIGNTSHMDFTDHPLISPWRKWTQPDHILPERIQTIVREYVLAFFDQTIRGQSPLLLQSGRPGPFNEVKIEQWIPVSKAKSGVHP